MYHVQQRLPNYSFRGLQQVQVRLARLQRGGGVLRLLQPETPGQGSSQEDAAPDDRRYYYKYMLLQLYYGVCGITCI